MRTNDPSTSPGSPFTRIIALDPGTNITGYGVLEEEEGEIAVLDAGVIKNSTRALPAAKLNRIHRGVAELIRRHLPQALVLEDVFYHKNIKSTLKLGEVRGVCSLAASQGGIPVFSYSARRAKKAVVGRGEADKSQVRRMVKEILGLEELPPYPDVSDALALGITFFQDHRARWEEE